MLVLIPVKRIELQEAFKEEKFVEKDLNNNALGSNLSAFDLMAYLGLHALVKNVAIKIMRLSIAAMITMLHRSSILGLVERTALKRLENY
jgi:hypothetical protein